MDFYDDADPTEKNQSRLLRGYCGYDKTEIYDDDDYVEYRGQLYHRENFVQMNLGVDGQGINDE